MALSPDGTRIAFVANQDRVPVLWVRSLDAIENRALPGTEGASFPFWSPDGRTIGFFADNKLKRIDIAGGEPLVVADAPNARGGAWNADGVILFAPGVSAPIMRVPARGGPVEGVTQVNTGSGPAHRLPQFLPDGKRFLFSSTLGGAGHERRLPGLARQDAAGAPAAGRHGGRFVAPDKLLAINQGALQAYSFDAASGAVQGEPVLHRAGIRRRQRDRFVCHRRHRCAGVSRRHRAAPAAGLGQPAGRRAAGNRRAGNRLHRVAGAERRRAVGRRLHCSAPATTTSG